MPAQSNGGVNSIMSKTISKKRHNDNPNSFEHLYQLGLTYIQQLSGHLWTDYNTHDPGMTILEQVCYALTDLIYRCEFEVTDYLSEPSGNIDYRAHGLALAQDIIPAYPQQPEEYETWLLARLPELEKVWLRWSEDAPQLGIYTLNVQLNHFYALSQQGPVASQRSVYTQQHAAIQRIRHEFYQVRAIGEDLSAIELTGQHPLTLTAVIHISDDIADVTWLAAKIYHRIGLWLEANTQNMPATVIKESLLAEDGILQIDRLEFSQHSSNMGDEEPTPIDNIAPFSYLTLPRPSAHSDIEIIQFQHPVNLDYANLAIQIEQIQYQQRFAQLKTVTPPALPVGRYFEFSRYESIQTLFPRNYHLAPGMPNQYHAQQQAQRHQLRSYLLLFDQLMANFCDDVAGLNSLFSLSLTTEATYHAHRLHDDEFYNIGKHYPHDASTRLDQLRAQLDDYPERKNRIFNYLLALYSERFPEWLHRQFNPYFSAQTLEKQLLKYKQVFILNIVTMTNGRGIGDNLLQPEHQGGYRQRLSLLLGLFPLASSQGSYTQAIARYSLNLVPNSFYFPSDTGKTVLWSLSPEAKASLLPLADNRLVEYPNEDDIEHTLLATSLFHGRTLPDVLLQFGIDNRRYRLLPRAEHDDYLLFFNTGIEGTQEGLYIASHSDKQALTQLCHQLQRWLIELNQSSEGLYVVEPILLRTGDASDYANRVTLVLPGYTARFSNPRFREHAEQLIIENSPAHLLTQCLWLDFAAFGQFETLYSQWRHAKSNALQRKEDQPECDAIAQQLYQFIQRSRNETDEALSL
ncbi:hypothetical protein [Candidatus Symbiopectobacterium sp. NZEC151]|uniref:hypothetical protein n=2 Tax=unclassified Symbiopectobacterium TaxID=2794573 RepID=UPI002227A190|nr:hypothetical protein [Candidatus Symbiopectobacterium sp. NZEC151]MCW2473921.1 hypothetical protein [Candidatus Symbiopectobacterium sp. NZEC151]